jgi:hypothetical protein
VLGLFPTPARFLDYLSLGALVHRLDPGINYFDNADVYGQSGKTVNL